MNENFVKNSLLPDEKIVSSAKWHWLKWAQWLLLSIFFVLADVILHSIGGSIFEDDGFFIAVLFGSIIVGGGFALLAKYLAKFDEFVITNKRVVAKVGLIRRVAFELHSEQVESIEISQGILGRILNYGTLMPCGVGASKVRIQYVINPFEIRQHFYDLKKPQNID